MPCSSPIWIRNRRYSRRDVPFSFIEDAAKSSLALAPWDISRQWLMVPCGKCEDCLRRLRNDWYVRLERELAHCKAEQRQAIFVTITINPKYYESALQDPSSFIRKWNERIRHKFGKSVKHCFFQEFGTHPQSGSEPRLHYHGFLFGTGLLYNQIRSCVADLGFLWLTKASHKRCRYAVKYVVKQIHFDACSIEGKRVTIDGKDRLLADVLSDRRYTRKFVSPGVGNYLGLRPRPSARVTSWDYLDFKSGRTFSYAIPRYYSRYLKPEDSIVRQVRAADSYARFSSSPLVRFVVDFCVKRFLPSSALSYRDSYSWEMRKFRELSAAGPIPLLRPPAWLDSDIMQSWYDLYGLSLT